MIPAVPMAALAVFRRIALEIGAGQVIQQDLEARTEQAFPARLEKAEERALVRDQLVQAAVQGVRLRHAQVFVQQVTDGGVGIPLSMQTPFTARIDQAIDHQGLQHVQPVRALATGR
jgi:hypothetical protein